MISVIYIDDVGLALTAPRYDAGAWGWWRWERGRHRGYLPLTPLSSVGALAGESITGDWTLTATDNCEGDDGVINNESLWRCVHPDRTVLGSASPGIEVTSGGAAVSSVELNSAGEVSPDELEVLIDLSHSYRGDLQVNEVLLAQRDA